MVTSQSLNQFLLYRSAAISLALPWIFGMLPLMFLTAHSVDVVWLKAVVAATADWIPMIKRMARQAKNPEWIQFALACLWASGPIWTVMAAILGVRTVRARIYPQKDLSGGFFLFAFLFFGGVMFVFATVGPKTWRLHDLTTIVFTEPLGLFLIGWFLITFSFVVIGLISALPLSKFFGEEK
jgi:hypothetical protein